MATEKQIKEFEQTLINTWRKRIEEYNGALTMELAQFGSVEVSSSGDFKDPATGKEYGFKLIIGQPGFWKDNDETEEEEE